MSPTLLVAVGGVVGCVARFWLTVWVQTVSGSEFPLGTLAVNVIGSFLIGLVTTLSFERGLLDAGPRIFLTTGFCGGFTTMSTFSYESIVLLRGGSPVAALSNVAVTLLACLGAVWLGGRVARLP
jgi:CrcB protein